MNRLHNFQPQPPLKTVPQAAGGRKLFPASSRSSFLPPLWEKLPVDGAFDILATNPTLPKGLQRLQGKTFKDKEEKNIKEKNKKIKPYCLSLASSRPSHPNKYSKNRNIKNTSPVLSSFSALCLESLVRFSVGPSCWLWLYPPSVPDPEKPKPVKVFLSFFG